MKTANKQYSEVEVVKSLNKKNDVRIDNFNNPGVIQILNQAHCKGDIGIKSKGKIDFLTRYCGYRKAFVSHFMH